MTGRFLLLLTICLGVNYNHLSAQNSPTPIGLVGFYNLENLFDTEDDPAIKDEEYLPEGKNEWTQERYHEKLQHMASVIKAMAGGPDILGVAEIENRKVLEDLVTTPELIGNHYQIVQFDSPDLRGIDVALIYKPKSYQPFVVKRIPFIDESDPEFKTRDMLWTKGLFHGDTLNMVVCHWPSRRGGKEEKRLIAGQILRHAVDSVQSINPNAKIIIMGDFNDDPSNKSISKYLNTDNKISKLEKGQLYNTSEDTFKKGYGTLYYKGTWNLFDQIIISQSLLKGKSDNYYYLPDSYTPFGPAWMRVQEGQYKGAPFRTFSYGKYQGGYSDHFPSLITIGK